LIAESVNTEVLVSLDVGVLLKPQVMIRRVQLARRNIMGCWDH
jgi:hypothetical protein